MTLRCGCDFSFLPPYLNLHRPTDAARKARTHDLLERLTSGELETSRLETELADAHTLTDATADRLRTVEVFLHFI